MVWEVDSHVEFYGIFRFRYPWLRKAGTMCRFLNIPYAPFTNEFDVNFHFSQYRFCSITLFN